MKRIMLSMILLLLACVITIQCVSIGQISADEFNFSSKSYLLLDVDSGQVLTSYNEHEKMPVASICKLMTSLITIEQLENNKLSLEDRLIASEYACSMEGSQAFLDVGSQYEVKDLLKSVIVASANDSSVVLAEAIGGSEQAFTKLMNDKAISLGMKNTLYANSNGLPSLNQYSTAHDTSILLKEISKYDIYHEYSKIWMDELIHESGRKTELVNTNRLIKYYNYCISGKTGFTDEAGYCLASNASNGKLNLIAVVLKCDKMQDRFNESVQLFNYGFTNYENKKIVDKDEALSQEIIVHGGKSKLSVKPSEDFYRLSRKGEEQAIQIEYEIMELKAPIIQNQVCGKIIISKDGVIIKEINLIASHVVEQKSIRDIVRSIAQEWLVK